MLDANDFVLQEGGEQIASKLTVSFHVLHSTADFNKVTVVVVLGRNPSQHRRFGNDNQCLPVEVRLGYGKGLL
jgi:hypothetical protein